MEVIPLLIFVGAIWVLAAIGFFAWNLLVTNHEHTDRLAMLPLEDNWTDARLRDGEKGKSKPS
jgi:hypothetical protein